MHSSIMSVHHGFSCDRCSEASCHVVVFRFGGKSTGICLDCIEDRCIQQLPLVGIPLDTLMEARALGRGAENRGC